MALRGQLRNLPGFASRLRRRGGDRSAPFRKVVQPGTVNQTRRVIFQDHQWLEDKAPTKTKPNFFHGSES